MAPASDLILLPDAGPLNTLAYADALDLLFKPGWTVNLVDMVHCEVIRNHTPTSRRIAQWVEQHKPLLLNTTIFQRYKQALEAGGLAPKRANLGELAIQEAMNGFALVSPPATGIFLFEDHKIARTSFLLPDNCRKISTRAFLLFLEQKGWLESAAHVERKATLAGRSFSRLRFPP